MCKKIWRKNKVDSIKLRQNDEFIKLGQALKAAGLVESGVEAKEVIQDGLDVYKRQPSINKFYSFYKRQFVN